MGSHLFVFLIALVGVAALLREEFLFTLVYLLLGVYLLGRWWGTYSLKHVKVKRQFDRHIYLGERSRVTVDIVNQSILPAAWVQIQESIPVEISGSEPVRQVVSLPSRGKSQVEYWLEGRKRGYYPVGPMRLYSGDVLGIIDQESYEVPAEHVTVYPRIIPLNKVAIPPSAPMGSIRHTQPLFEDPSRAGGKRAYGPGDSLRRVDWKATAATGNLQVKLFEPAIALETAIFLNMYAPDYEDRQRYEATELGVIVAASLATWVIRKRQAAGFMTNGIDLLTGAPPSAVPVKGGQGHLMRILEVLARVNVGETDNFAGLIQHYKNSLSWGTTLAAVTGALNDDGFDALFLAQRAGLGVMLVLVGRNRELDRVEQRARRFGIACTRLERERDLDVWRK